MGHSHGGRRFGLTDSFDEFAVLDNPGSDVIVVDAFSRGIDAGEPLVASFTIFIHLARA